MKKWYLCPYCKKRIGIYTENTVCKELYIKCKKCGKQVEVKVKSL